ncbi:MAG: tyrosine-type recombinase/integrase [Cyclobacteriaceae bacterium]|nr:tyrosine-type recombinase/integrase [Cyclobacteriaceae bacterium]
MELRPEVEQYIKHIECVRRYSKHTITAYRTDLKQFSYFLKGDLLTASRKDVREFLIDLQANKYSFRSINRKLEVLRSFYRYYRKFTDFENYPCSFVRNLRFEKPRGTYLTVEKIREVLDAIQPGGNRKIVRDQLVLELLYQTGCRADEIINLRKKDVNFRKRQIKVVGKGKVERLIPLSKRVVKLIKVHLKLWKDKNTGLFLLTNNKGKPLYPMYLWRLIRKYFKVNTIGVGVSAHTIRHSCATHLYHNRAPIKAIRDLLGHRSLRSTEAYLHLDLKSLIRIYNDSHPKAGTVRKKRGGHLSDLRAAKGERRETK